MKEKRYGTLGSLTVPVMTYSSFEEADKAAGKTGVLLDIANDNLHYRGGPAAATREAIVTILNGENLTVSGADGKEVIIHKGTPFHDKHGKEIHVKMKDSGKKDDKGNAVMTADESEGEFVRRFLANVHPQWVDAKGDSTLEKIQPIIDKWAKVADEGHPLSVDAKEPERKPKAPPKLSKEDTDLATRLIDGKASMEKFAKACAQFAVELHKPTGNREADITALAWNANEYYKRKAAADRANARAAF